jgi:hypothetical protein
MSLPYRTSSRTCWSLLSVVLLLLVAAPAQAKSGDAKTRAGKTTSPPAADEPAAGPDTSKAGRERAAKRACLTGDATGGVAILTDLYIDTNDPTYLFNQGRCFEQNRRYEDAIGRFREYLVKAKGLRQEDRAEAEQHIAACESYLGSKPAEPAKPEPRPTVETTTVAPAPALVTSPELVTTTASRPQQAGSGLRVAGLVLGAAGVAGLATGLVLNLKANGMSSDLENQYDPGVDSSRKSYKTGAWIGYGAGAACLAGGVVLYAIGWSRGRDGSAVALVPTVAPGMAGTVLMGAF